MLERLGINIAARSIGNIAIRAAQRVIRDSTKYREGYLKGYEDAKAKRPNRYGRQPDGRAT